MTPVTSLIALGHPVNGVGTLEGEMRRINMPAALASLYAHVGCAQTPFTLERLAFRAFVDVVCDATTVTFADEGGRAMKMAWSYNCVDDIVVSTHGDVVVDIETFLSSYAAREMHQRAQNHQRHTEKCVNGVPIPSPDLAPATPHWSVVDD